MKVLVVEPITFEVGDRVVHSPMVHADIAGVKTKLILDSGASDHVFTMDLVRRAGLTPGEAEAGFDHVGASMPSVTLGRVPITLAGMEVALGRVYAFDGPAEFRAWGIGGFLSPQSLHPSAWAAVDLVDNELLLIDGATSDLSSWLQEQRPGFELLSLERLADETQTLVVPAAIEPFPTVTTMLNTGSSSTEFAAAAVPGLTGVRAEGSGFGLSGASVDGEEVTDQVLRVGGRALPVSVLLIRDPMPAPPGLVGMDVLAGTILAVHGDRRHPVLWLVPTSPA